MDLPGFAAFADESRHCEGQFRSVAAISIPSRHVLSLNERLRDVMQRGCVAELKWHKVKGAKARFCAMAALSAFIPEFIHRGGRADILIWDVQDSRHRVLRRNDRKNFERMFFHLHKALMSRRPLGEEWHIRPDERLDIDWETIRACLSSVGGWKRYFESPLLGESLSVASFQIRSFREARSVETPLCQLADLFAGMGAYSRLRCRDLKLWLEEQSGQVDLFGRPEAVLTGRDKERFPVIKHLSELCEAQKLGVSLEAKGYLRTLDPRNPINFWHYTPQHDADRAPTDQ
jgi:hypothetical protein